MQYVYVLQSEKDGEMYAGSTMDIQKRILLHNSGKVLSTSKRIPFVLIYYEVFLNKTDAFTTGRNF